jgi:hypothetical protein
MMDITQALFPAYVETGLRREPNTLYSQKRLAGPITAPGRDQAEPQVRERQIEPYPLLLRAKKAEPCKTRHVIKRPVLLSRLLFSLVGLSPSLYRIRNTGQTTDRPKAMVNKAPGIMPNSTVNALELMSSASYCMAWYYSGRRTSLGKFMPDRNDRDSKTDA